VAVVARRRLGIRIVVVQQELLAGAVEIVILAGSNRPYDRGAHDDNEEQRDRNEQIDDFNRVPVQLPRLIRAAFATTMSELRDMPSAAIHGGTIPAMASGRAQTL